MSTERSWPPIKQDMGSSYVTLERIHRTAALPAEQYYDGMRDKLLEQARKQNVDPKVVETLFNAGHFKAVSTLLATPSASPANNSPAGDARQIPAWAIDEVRDAVHVKGLLERYSLAVRDRVVDIASACDFSDAELVFVLSHPAMRPDEKGEPTAGARYLLSMVAALGGGGIKLRSPLPIDWRCIVEVDRWLSLSQREEIARPVVRQFLLDASDSQSRSTLRKSIESLTEGERLDLLNAARSLVIRGTDLERGFVEGAGWILRVAQASIDFDSHIEQAKRLAGDGRFGEAHVVLSWVREVGETKKGGQIRAFEMLHALKCGRWADACRLLRMEMNPALDELALAIENTKRGDPVRIDVGLLARLRYCDTAGDYVSGLAALGAVDGDGISISNTVSTTTPSAAINRGLEHIPESLIHAAREMKDLNDKLDARSEETAPAAPPAGLESMVAKARHKLERECEKFLNGLGFKSSEESAQVVRTVAMDLNVIRHGHESTVRTALEELRGASGGRGFASIAIVRDMRVRACFIPGTLIPQLANREDIDTVRGSVYHDRCTTNLAMRL